MNFPIDSILDSHVSIGTVVGFFLDLASSINFFKLTNMLFILKCAISVAFAVASLASVYEHFEAVSGSGITLI